MLADVGKVWPKLDQSWLDLTSCVAQHNRGWSIVRLPGQLLCNFQATFEQLRSSPASSEVLELQEYKHYMDSSL